MKLKHLIKIVCVSMGFLLSSHIHAQTKLLSASNTDLPQDKQSQDVIRNLNYRAVQGTIKHYYFDKKALLDKSIVIETPNGSSYTFLLDELDTRANQDFTWHGHIADNTGGNAFIVFLNGQISGQVEIGSKKYAIAPFGTGVVSVYEIDNSKVPQDHPTFDDGLVPSGKEDSSSTADNVTCRVRVLVAYTNQASSGAAGLGYSDMKLFIQQAVSETNQGFINSAVSHRIELAVAVNVSYTESGDYNTDLNRFQGTADGYMDNIHTYRSLYGADLCAMIFNNSAYCGLAYTINAVASQAFCVVHYDCAVGYYSFGHELGHLFGARHNVEADPTTTPYAYGHGKCYTPGNWRTIMSYSCSGETRINYWSNPNILYGGVATGDATTRNNARVLNERDAIVAAFVSTPSFSTITSNGSIRSTEIGDALATTQVKLSPGFVAANGSIFHAYTGTCSGGFKYGQFDNASSSADADIITSVNVNLYPNPTNGPIYLDLKYDSPKSVTISVINMLGDEIFRENLGTVSEKSIPVNLQGHSAGIYLIKVEADHEVQTRQVVIQK